VCFPHNISRCDFERILLRRRRYHPALQNENYNVRSDSTHAHACARAHTFYCFVGGGVCEELLMSQIVDCSSLILSSKLYFTRLLAFLDINILFLATSFHVSYEHL
jgi:hypothetical protein